ncbi:MAG: hypothetical protein QM638_12045 [Nocardioides sp.]|uniref:hypothetical protein n=1 Tax=Nocardioides sp. TaxID=35761 RepID=UPI0039E3D172
MPRISVEVHATVGSAIGRSHRPEHSLFARPHHTDGLPVGWGEVAETQLRRGDPLRALVLMSEPALPQLVHAWPIGVLHLAGRAPEDILACVAEERPFLDLIDLVHCADWDARPEAWVRALRVVRPGTPHHLAGCGGVHEANALLAEALPAETPLAGVAGLAPTSSRA